MTSELLREHPDNKITLISGHEGRHQGHDEHEQTDEAPRDPEDHAGVQEAVSDHRHEGGDNE